MSGGVVFEDECRNSLLKIVYSNSIESGERRIGDGVIHCVGSVERNVSGVVCGSGNKV